jgi:NADP-dependent 3-hydroxy acid dehydrogenase YdfG
LAGLNILYISCACAHGMAAAYMQDLNFWGAVYPTYFALPYLKASRGNIVVTASVAGRVPTARMSFYNVRT